MTRSAQEFVGGVTFEAVTGRAVHAEIFGPGRALDHIRLAREASAIVIAPATADFIARAASGHADDLLSACLLATDAPVLFVPAMNDRMWRHPQTARNVAHLAEIGYAVLPPDEGPLAVGEGSGPGRMPEPEVIYAHIGRLLESRGSLAGRKVVVSAGGTREPIDPVRFISNHSSGKMGVAIAAAAWRRGADVTLVAGHLETAIPVGVRTVAASTTEEMARIVEAELPSADVLVMAAAPADFRPAAAAKKKLKKSDGAQAIELDETPDILSTTRNARKAGSVTVGFALETDDGAANAKKKLAAKGLDLIVLNSAGEEGAGFGTDTNRVTIFSVGSDAKEHPTMPKTEVADIILDRVEELLRGR